MWLPNATWKHGRAAARASRFIATARAAAFWSMPRRATAKRKSRLKGFNAAYPVFMVDAYDAWNTIEDVAISDYYEQNSVSGYTDKAGMICFNKYCMSRYSSAEKQHTCTHELGHALGLAHNQFGDIMYAELTYHTVLSENDKASYDASYNR